jgi:hypothetical protein
VLNGEITRPEAEIQKMISAGPLRPGYYNAGQFSLLTNLVSYFENPGDTLYTLAIAYPYLSPQLQQQVRSYLKNWFQTYFAVHMYATTGWANGAPREAVPLPPEIANRLGEYGPSEYADWLWSWDYPQNNFYALWKYVQLFPEDAGTAYQAAKSRLAVPVPGEATDSYLLTWPYELNGYIAGYMGFLNLQEQVGKSTRTAVS